MFISWFTIFTRSTQTMTMWTICGEIAKFWQAHYLQARWMCRRLLQTLTASWIFKAIWKLCRVTMRHGIFLYNSIFTKRSWLLPFRVFWSLLAPAKFRKMMQRCDESIIHLRHVVEGVRVRSCMDTGQLGGGKVTCFKVSSVVNNHTFTHSLCTRRPKTTFSWQFCLHETH